MTTPLLSPQRRRRLSSYFVLAIALLIVGAGYSALAPSGYADTTASPDLVAKGQQLFTLNCATCHGMDAKGSGEAPDLTKEGAAAVDFQVGTGRMPLAAYGQQAKRKPPKFTQPEIDALAAYVGSLGNGPAVPTMSLAGGDVARGGRIFSENCAQCHNVVGQGGALTGGKAAPTLRLATDKQVWEALSTAPGNMPNFLRQLNDGDKKDVIAYVMSVRTEYDNGGAPIGRLGPVPEGAVGWVVGVGGIVLLCVWIGTRI